jgi:hypothetical protein
MDPFRDKDGHQVRERSVPCGVCEASTWNVSARCDQHEEKR